MSIESQRTELSRAFGGLEMLDIIEEAMSAKEPGRPAFNRIIERIEAGEAEGLIAWAPDRLARNSVDGGRIIYLLDRGLIRDLKFATYTYENNSQGKFMLSIMFGQSKYYSDALSENVRRGLRTKIERGGHPNLAPFGYRNDQASRSVVPDPLYFPLVRRMFDLALTGAHSAREIARIARDEWGVRTPKRKRVGGTPIATSTVHRLLTRPFYAGLITSKGQVYQGAHVPVVSLAEFDTVQRLLSRPRRQKPERHRFAYTGLIQCGACRLSVTAEHKVNRHGSRYVYYHCTRRRPDGNCSEPSVELDELERQVRGFLSRVALHPLIEPWIWKHLDQADDAQERQAIERSLRSSLSEIEDQRQELLSLRTRGLIDDTEFTRERGNLEAEAARLTERLEAAGATDSLEPLQEVASFSSLAVEWFDQANVDQRRLIVSTVGSNPTLKGRMLSISAAKPFIELGEIADCLMQRGGVDVLRTRQIVPRRLRQRLRRVSIMLREDEYGHILPNIRLLRSQFEGADDHLPSS